MEEKIEISILLELYGNLLTEKQYEFMEDYYNGDLSLSEIAENQNITRQAVREILAKSKNKLKEYEQKLGILKKEQNIEKQLESLEKTKLTSEQQEIIQKINDQLDF